MNIDGEGGRGVSVVNAQKKRFLEEEDDYSEYKDVAGFNVRHQEGVETDEDDVLPPPAEPITIKVKRVGGGGCLPGDSCLTLKDVDPDTTVIELKQRIYDELAASTRGVATAIEVAVPVERQRLIYMGRMLTVDRDRLGSDVKMKPGSAAYVHLVPIPKGKKPSARKRGENKGIGVERTSGQGSLSCARRSRSIRSQRESARTRGARQHVTRVRDRNATGSSFPLYAAAGHPYYRQRVHSGRYGILDSVVAGVSAAGGSVAPFHDYHAARALHATDPPAAAVAAAQRRHWQEVAMAAAVAQQNLSSLETAVGMMSPMHQHCPPAPSPLHHAVSRAASTAADTASASSMAYAAAPSVLGENANFPTRSVLPDHAYEFITTGALREDAGAVANSGYGSAGRNSRSRSESSSWPTRTLSPETIDQVSQMARGFLPGDEFLNSRILGMCNMLDNEAQHLRNSRSDGSSRTSSLRSAPSEQQVKLARDISSVADHLERVSRESGYLASLLRSIEVGLVHSQVAVDGRPADGSTAVHESSQSIESGREERLFHHLQRLSSVHSSGESVSSSLDILATNRASSTVSLGAAGALDADSCAGYTLNT